MPHPVAIVGVGKIARDQHIPAIAADPDFALVAGVSRHETIDGVPNFTDIDAFLADGPEAAVALCVPPGVRTAMALKALGAGRDVLLEKPPAATLGEVEAMVAAARAGGRVLFATWHSRFAHAVAPARAWLDGADGAVGADRLEGGRAALASGAGLDSGSRRGSGSSIPGINALSILTEILPGAFMVREATLTFPENRDTPIAATLEMTGAAGFPVAAEFDWRQQGPQSWDISVETDGGRLELRNGGALMLVDGAERASGPDREYPNIYRRFAGLLARRESDVDASPLRICADAFLMGRRVYAEPFHD